MDFASPYLSRQLIAYIGNKRSLLPFVGGLFDRLAPGRGVLLDPFAGSGAVARLARLMGFQTIANDWEPYARLMNEAFLTVSARQAGQLFGHLGGLEAAFAHYNSLKSSTAEPYMARWYAPKTTEGADFRTERLFYTAENAAFLDRVRSAVEHDYPDIDLSVPGEASPRRSEKLLLTASLLYEASVHSNTNGVFKAFHKGFGGHGKDALGRILSPMQLEIPALADAPHPGQVCSLDAARFVQGRPAEVIYLDPPYNQHQYGSNYHILNTLALWDRLPAPLDLGPDGRLKDKAGIRRDWTARRSPFCVRSQAPQAFAALIAATDARSVVLSYNTEGIIPFETLWETLSTHGKTELLVQDYVTYRGGRQSPDRQVHNLELLLVLTRGQKSQPGSLNSVRRFMLEKKLFGLLRKSFHPGRLAQTFAVTGSDLQLAPAAGNRPALSLRLDSGLRFLYTPASWAAFSVPELEAMLAKLEDCLCRSHQEEAVLLLEMIETAPPKVAAARQRRLLQVLRKFAFKKYKSEFFGTLELARQLAARLNGAGAGLSQGLDQLEALARLRITN